MNDNIEITDACGQKLYENDCIAFFVTLPADKNIIRVGRVVQINEKSKSVSIEDIYDAKKFKKIYGLYERTNVIIEPKKFTDKRRLLINTCCCIKISEESYKNVVSCAE